MSTIPGPPGRESTALPGQPSHPHGFLLAASSPGGLTVSYYPRASASRTNELPVSAAQCDLVGEARLDNREELHRLLPGTSRQLSDLEWIARAYARWGLECLEHLQGDFAFALWDADRQRLFCARDPLGVRPLYYRFHGLRFVCALELKALLADPDYCPAPDEAMLAEYLLGWSHFPDTSATFYRDLRQLPAGHYLVLEQARLAIRRYWDVDPAEEVRYRRPLHENVEEFRSLFRRAVLQRLQTQGKVGILVSGGLDSTSIACLALEASRTENVPRLYMLNYYLPAPYGDERAYLRTFEAKYGCQVESLGPQAFRLLDGLDEVARKSETPFLDPIWSLARQWVERVRALNARVLLSGFGGDNIFPDAHASCTDTFRLAGWWAGRERLHRLARYWDMRPTTLWPSVLRALLPPQLKSVAKRILGKEVPSWIRRDFARRSGLLERVRQPLPRKGFSSPSQELTYLHLTSGRLATQFAFYDGLGAANQFEARYPFFDPAVVRFSLLVPWGQHTEGGEIKILLREAMRGLLPEPIRQRRDKGTPDYFLAHWLRTREAHKLKSLASQELFMASYLKRECFSEMVQAFLGGRDGVLKPLWLLLSLEFWLKKNFDGLRAR